ncbi:hypothetical protein QBC41DRAFT_145220 [Cercophora samala]|uniref:Uncharacterized protein n=1 Tax=Cercophora samala TaxID=330535 RepID=A0AA39ZAQ9_9PEZI|nr:hypothetical protein QBC41DRAFT_145220 [Cercophora samala]
MDGQCTPRPALNPVPGTIYYPHLPAFVVGRPVFQWIHPRWLSGHFLPPQQQLPSRHLLCSSTSILLIVRKQQLPLRTSPIQRQSCAGCRLSTAVENAQIGDRPYNQPGALTCQRKPPGTNSNSSNSSNSSSSNYQQPAARQMATCRTIMLSNRHLYAAVALGSSQGPSRHDGSADTPGFPAYASSRGREQEPHCPCMFLDITTPQCLCRLAERKLRNSPP